MYKYACLNEISKKGLEKFDDNYELTEVIEEAAGLLVRSASLHGMNFSKQLLAVARAGAGVNNIPLEACATSGIVVFNTPGANANSVKELVLCGMLLGSRDILGGIDWVKGNATNEEIAKLAEKKKSAFAGNEIAGKTLGIIGMGNIGSRVAKAAIELGMEVLGYDPYISVDSAWNLPSGIRHIQNIDDIYRESDFITIHMPLLEGTKKTINDKAFSLMKPNCVLLNFARDLLVDEEALIVALEEEKIAGYVTDFPNPTVVKAPRTIIMPHIGASTEESEDNCAKMAVNELRNYLENGNIINSVNYPNCDMGKKKVACRITINHQNIKNMIGQFTGILTEEDINIANMVNGSRGDIAYSMFDVENIPSQGAIQRLNEVEGVYRVRVI